MIMNMVQEEIILEIRAAGVTAAVSGMPRVPAMCPVFSKSVKGFTFGDGIGHLADEWVEAYNTISG